MPNSVKDLPSHIFIYEISGLPEYRSGQPRLTDRVLWLWTFRGVYGLGLCEHPVVDGDAVLAPRLWAKPFLRLPLPDENDQNRFHSVPGWLERSLGSLPHRLSKACPSRARPSPSLRKSRPRPRGDSTAAERCSPLSPGEAGLVSKPLLSARIHRRRSGPSL